MTKQRLVNIAWHVDFSIGLEKEIELSTYLEFSKWISEVVYFTNWSFVLIVLLIETKTSPLIHL